MAKVKYRIREYTPKENMPGTHGYYAQAVPDLYHVAEYYKAVGAELTGRASKQQDGIRRGLYNMNLRNKKKLNRALELLDNMKTQ